HPPLPQRGRARRRLPRLPPSLQSPPRPHRTQGRLTRQPRTQPPWSVHLEVFNRATVEGWVNKELERSPTCRSWMSYIRDFGRWMRTHRDPDSYVLSDQWKAGFTRTRPYLLTSSE